MPLELLVAFGGLSITLVGIILSMMYWMRSEANQLRLEAKEDRKDMLQMIRSIEIEIKDFHYQLLNIKKELNK